MEIQHFEQFKQELALGKRAEAAAALKPFIASFSSFEEKVQWSKWYLENETFGHKIRHELYEHIIFPVLLDGFHRSEPWSIRWLSRTIQNLYQSKPLWEQIGCKSDYMLLTELVALCPEDNEARCALLIRLIDEFRYCVHEWPSGILYGINGATIEECSEILEDILLARKLDNACQHSCFLDDFNAKVLEYQQRLTNRSTRTSPL